MSNIPAVYTPPYIRDRRNPRCPECGSDIYVQADSYSQTIRIGKEEKQQNVYTVKEMPDEQYPVVMSACKCGWP